MQKISFSLRVIVFLEILFLASFSFAVNPDEISGLKLWLDAQDTPTFVGENNLIRGWGNKADPANPAQQLNADNQPTYTGNGLNGKPAAYFDGAADFLSLASSIRETAGEFQLLLVARGESGGDIWPRFFSSYSGDEGDQWVAPNAIVLSPNNVGAAVDYAPAWFYSTGYSHVLQNITLGTDAKIPGTNSFKGYIGEVLVFDRALSAEEFNQMVDYLIDHWDLNTGYDPPQGVNLNPRLRDLGDALGLKMGAITAINFYDFEDTSIYQQVLGENFGIFTPENDTKYSLLSTGQGTYDFTALDRHVAFAEANNMKLHGHVFIWHSQLPDWLSNGTWTRPQLIDILKNHIDTVGGYLKGKVAIWDVVNEPFNDPDGSWRSSVWNNVIDADNSEANQRDFIDLAFQRARQVDPDAKLILNDYANEVINAKSNAMYAWAQSMVARGIPLDGVGFQMHLTGHIDYESFSQNMQRFADLGLEIHLTELDVRIVKPFTTEKSIYQASVYREVLRRALDQPVVKSFTTWGFTDAYSWIPQFFQGTDNALIFDEDYNPKHAFVAIQEELLAHLSAEKLRTRLLGLTALSPNSALDKDLDHDGLSTLFEIAMKLDPETADFKNHPLIQLSPDVASAEFTPRSFTSDIELRVETSHNLKDWEIVAQRAPGSTDWEVVKHGVNLAIHPESGKVTITDTSLASPAFLRIAALQVSQD